MADKFVKSPVVLIVTTCVILLVNLVTANIVDEMNGKSVEVFKNLLMQSSLASQYLSNELTIFAPSDGAMAKYTGPKDDQLIMNHMVNVVVQVNDRASYSDVTRVSSLLPGSPPLWLTQHGASFFVSGAKIIMRNLEAYAGNRKQRLHIIDSVLEPLVPSVADNSQAFIDLTAGKLLRESDAYRIEGYSIRNFSSQVRSMKKFDLFDLPGRHTFFIPVDSAFMDLEKKLVVSDVIAGHVIPNKLVFTAPLDKVEQKTATYTDVNVDDIKVTAIIQSTSDGFKVKSTTVQGSRNHPRENVKANLVIGNIPVANGVVHLIDKPLIIVASPLWDYLQEEKEKNGRLSKFASYVQTFGGGLKEMIGNVESGTIFAPNNDAFDRLSQTQLEALLGSEAGPRILGLHFIDQRIPAEDVRILQPQNEIKMFGTNLPFPAESPDHLWFYYINNNRTFMLDGQGVTAEVVEPDIGATNGVIHVIDRVLGVPQHTIAEKLAMDPMMSSVYSLGNQNHFNNMFNNTDEKFTYIVPANLAWDEVNRQFTSGYKILFMGTFAYQTQTILERHLKIGEGLTTAQLIEKTKEGPVTMLRGAPGFKFVEKVDEVDGSTYTVIEWEDLQARIIRPNMECSNGIIHVIDKVIMKERDVVLALSNALPKSVVNSVFITMVAAILVHVQ